MHPPSAKDLHPRKGEAYLDRFNVSFVDPKFSSIIWDRLRQHVPTVDGREATGLYHKLRFYKYSKGQRFGQHVDTCVRETEPDRVSEYTLLIYLNGQHDALPPVEGGETVFYATAKKVLTSFAPCAGSALLHAHGRRCLMHEGAEVTKGEKYLFRSDIMYPK
eukprot:m.162406 g.162406  ORF g.162406 m.162406 type:complete len:162 (-) comp17663_c0_seq4:26-511(-)